MYIKDFSPTWTCVSDNASAASCTCWSSIRPLGVEGDVAAGRDQPIGHEMGGLLRDALDGLGRLSYEAAVARDYPVLFGTLFIFGLMGLAVGILSDLMYVWVDPRIDFERRG